jgi:hypothetical protein
MSTIDHRSIKREIAPRFPKGVAMPHPAITPVFMLDGGFSTWAKLYDCTPPCREECRRFWWAIESAPWRRVSIEARARERREEAMRRPDQAALSVMALAEAAADWE